MWPDHDVGAQSTGSQGSMGWEALNIKIALGTIKSYKGLFLYPCN